ncbi:MAG TPA: EamA family transporter [Bacteroidetes bacterium]|nr:EamA family transporter [Bacteroidota bacterium]HRK05633.1 EamA family transporter [Chlorobiota bacterium]
MTHRLAVLALCLAALLWSTGGFFIKSLPLSPLAIAGWRSAIAAVVMVVWLQRPKPIWTGAQISTIVCYTLTVVLFVAATKLTTAANAILLQYTAPFWVVIGNVVLTRQRPDSTDILTVLLVGAGMTVFFVDRAGGGSAIGNVIAVLSGIAFAGVAMSMKGQRGVSTTESILLGNTITALICLPWMLDVTFTFDVTWRLIALGSLQLGVSYILYARAISSVTALEAVLLTTLEPLLNPLWVAVLFGELPSSTSVIGGLLVVGAVIYRSFVHGKAIRQ